MSLCSSERWHTGVDERLEALEAVLFVVGGIDGGKFLPLGLGGGTTFRFFLEDFDFGGAERFRDGVLADDELLDDDEELLDDEDELLLFADWGS